MYEKHFGLRRRPFRTTPDSEGYYPATTHEQALERLAQGLQQDEGFLLLTGPTGMGKTLLCHRLLEQLGSQVASAFLTHCRFPDPASLLQGLLYEFSLPFEGRSEQGMRLALTERLLENFKAGQRTLILVDEAQHLQADVLEELRLLGNLEAPEGKAVQVVLVGLPPLAETLQLPGLAALRQRLAVRTVLEPLGPEEAADHLLHQIRVAGARPETLFASEALGLLARSGWGIPRLLNQAAHQALLLAAAAGQTHVDAEAALEALALLGLAADAEAADSAGAEEESAADDDSELRTFKLTPTFARASRSA